MTAGAGGAGTGTNTVGGAGGAISFTTGAGGASAGTGANANGGNFLITLGIAGIGGSGTAGVDGQFKLTGTAPASSSTTSGLAVGIVFNVLGITGGATSNAAGTAGIGSIVSINSGLGGAGTGTNAVGGAGGAINITAGAGGASAGTGINSNGGSIVLTPGAAGTGGSGTAGSIGNVQVAAGLLQVGTANCVTVGTGGGICGAEGTSTTNVSGASVLYFDSTQHEVLVATNGSASYGMLVRSQPGAVHQTAKTASITTATLCAASAGACNVAGQYDVHFDFTETGTACSSVTAGSVSFQLTWTDTNGTTHSAITVGVYDEESADFTTAFHFNTALGTSGASGDFSISSNGSIIQYATTYVACTTGTGTYQLDAVATRLQ